MAFWSAGLNTQASAIRATRWGGIAAVLQAARITIGNVASLTVADKPLDNAIVWFIGASLIPVVLLVSGTRLWRNQGWISGTLASIVVALDLVLFGPELISIPLVAGLILKGVLLVLIVNGLRGALALRRIDYEVRSTFR